MKNLYKIVFSLYNIEEKSSMKLSERKIQKHEKENPKDFCIKRWKSSRYF